jgi:benzoyl-CoA reductase subunit C
MAMQTAEDRFERCAEIISDVDFAEVKQWKAAHPGSKAIGYFPVYAPVELIHALGALPVGLNGAGDRLDIQNADARFGSFICSIVKTTLEMGMTGHLEPFDGMLFSSICDSARNLCFVFKRNFPELYVDFLHLPHNPSSAAGKEFLRGEYGRVQEHLEVLCGCPLNNVALTQAIELFNQNRAYLRRLYAFRAKSPHLLRTWELYSLMRAGNFLPVETHNGWLREALQELPERSAKPRDYLRVVIEGSFCEQPPLDLIKLLEEAGCYVVEDDFILGRRWFTEDVPVNGDPLGSLAESYLNRAVYSSVRHDPRQPRHKELLKRVERSRANAVILLIAKFCEPAYFDYVLFKRELESAGVPHLLLEFEEKAFTFERMRNEVETFVESLLFD